MRRQRFPGRALVPITWKMRRVRGTAAVPQTHARLPGAPSPARRSPSPPTPRPQGRAQGTPNSSWLGHWNPNFLRVAARSSGSCLLQTGSSPGRRRGARRMLPRTGATAAAAHPAPLGSATSEVSALTQPLLRLNCLWVSPNVRATPSFLPLLPGR